MVIFIKALSLENFKFLIQNLFKNKDSLDKISQDDKEDFLYNNEKVDAKSVNGFTIESNVPSNAVFADTIYNDEELKLKSHEHNNKAIIDKFSEAEDGKLLYNGSLIESGSSGGETNLSNPELLFKGAISINNEYILNQSVDNYKYIYMQLNRGEVNDYDCDEKIVLSDGILSKIQALIYTKNIGEFNSKMENRLCYKFSSSYGQEGKIYFSDINSFYVYFLSDTLPFTVVKIYGIK